MTHHYHRLILQKCRRRVWHFVLLSCRKSDRKAVKVEFNVKATNVLNGWQREYGADEENVVFILG